MPGLPDYNTQLSAFHRAFESELTAIIASLPLQPAMQVLDLACGDGFYTRRLAERLGPGGRVVGADVDPAYLDAARRETAAYAGPATIELVRASFDALPFADGTFDLVWCAQSLYSLPDPVDVLRHLRRVVRPGGVVGVLENDTLHQVFLPWPAPLELALRTAELQSLAAEEGNASKFYVGRRLPAVFAAAGLEPTAMTTIAIDRRAPFRDVERVLLQSYLDGVVERVTPYLAPAPLAELRELTEAGSPKSLVDQPNATLTWLNVLVTGTVVTPLGLESGKPSASMRDDAPTGGNLVVLANAREPSRTGPVASLATAALLDELESALEAGDQQRMRGVIGRLRAELGTEPARALG